MEPREGTETMLIWLRSVLPVAAAATAVGDVETVSALKPTGHALLAYPIEEVDALTLDHLRKYLQRVEQPQPTVG